MSARSKIHDVYAGTGGEERRQLRRLLSLYDISLKACVTGNLEQLEESVGLLQRKLDYARWPSLGLVLYAQYNRCRELGRAGNFIGAGRILATLRKAWTGAK